MTSSLLKITLPVQWESETKIAMDALVELGVWLSTVFSNSYSDAGLSIPSIRITILVIQRELQWVYRR